MNFPGQWKVRNQTDEWKLAIVSIIVITVVIVVITAIVIISQKHVITMLTNRKWHMHQG